MNVNRCELSDAPLDLIDRLAGNYFFGSTDFARLWQAIGGKPVFWLVEEAGRVLAILPGVEFGIGIFRRFQSMPDGCYGQVLFDSTVANDRLAVTKLILTRILSEGYMKVFLNDYHNMISKEPRFGIEKCLTHLVDISTPNWQPPDSKLRQQIHKAENEGVTLQSFHAAKHLDQFMNLVKLHERRRATQSNYTRPFFELLAELTNQDSRIRWVGCEVDGKLAESSIFFREGNSIIHWQMFYDETFSHFQPTKFVPFAVAKQAAANGIKYLNLGASPPDAEGAELYKSKWGGTPYSYNCFVYKNLLGRLL